VFDKEIKTGLSYVILFTGPVADAWYNAVVD
jgi:hypothetical protein